MPEPCGQTQHRKKTGPQADETYRTSLRSGWFHLACGCLCFLRVFGLHLRLRVSFELTKEKFLSKVGKKLKDNQPWELSGQQMTHRW